MLPFRLIIRGLDVIMESLCVAFGLVLGAIIVLICVDIFSRNLSIGSLPWMVLHRGFCGKGATSASTCC